MNDVLTLLEPNIPSFKKDYHLDQGLYTLDALQKEFNRITQQDIHSSNTIFLSAETSTSHVLINFVPLTSFGTGINLATSNNVMQLLGYMMPYGETTQNTIGASSEIAS